MATLFSKQNQTLPDVFQTAIVPQALRTQFLWIIRENFSVDGRLFGPMRDFIAKESALASLANKANPEADINNCIADSGNNKLVLDCMQVILTVVSGRNAPAGSNGKRAVAQFNRFCLESGFGYEFNVEAMTLIPIDSSLLHQEAVRPALHLLSKKAFATANKEYVAAFEHFKKGEFGDCLTECCKAVESTLKIIAHEKKWTVDPKATFQPLLKVYLQETGLDGFWEQPLIVLANLRNKMDAHGGGTKPHDVPKHIAQYSLNATGAAILFLIEGVNL